MDIVALAGYIGPVLSSITFLPQVIKAWQSKSMGDVSLLMLCIVLLSTVVWLVYGIGKDLRPVIIANSIICFLSLVLLYFKFTFKS